MREGLRAQRDGLVRRGAARAAARARRAPSAGGARGAGGGGGGAPGRPPPAGPARPRGGGGGRGRPGTALHGAALREGKRKERTASNGNNNHTSKNYVPPTWEVTAVTLFSLRTAIGIFPVPS